MDQIKQEINEMNDMIREATQFQKSSTTHQEDDEGGAKKIMLNS